MVLVSDLCVDVEVAWGEAKSTVTDVCSVVTFSFDRQ
jgi:hypothetical protein